MNINDGSIINLGQIGNFADLMNDENLSPFVEVKEKDMTKKQKKDRKVSLKDHRSKLGKQLTQVRKERKIGRNEPCPCGSGIKYKKCCHG